MKLIPISSFEPAEVSNREYAVRTLQSGIELHELKNYPSSVVIEYRDFTITATRLKNDDKWLFIGENGKHTFTDFNLGEHLELSIVDLKIDELILLDTQEPFLEELLEVAISKLDLLDRIELQSAMSTIGYCNCAKHFKLYLAEETMSDLKEALEALKEVM